MVECRHKCRKTPNLVVKATIYIPRKKEKLLFVCNGENTNYQIIQNQLSLWIIVRYCVQVHLQRLKIVQ